MKVPSTSKPEQLFTLGQIEEHKQKLHDTLIEYSKSTSSFVAQDAYKLAASIVLNTPLFITKDVKDD